MMSIIIQKTNFSTQTFIFTRTTSASYHLVKVEVKLAIFRIFSAPILCRYKHTVGKNKREASDAITDVYNNLTLGLTEDPP